MQGLESWPQYAERIEITLTFEQLVTMPKEEHVRYQMLIDAAIAHGCEVVSWIESIGIQHVVIMRPE